MRILLDGHCAQPVCERLGISAPSTLSRWKRELLGEKYPLTHAGEPFGVARVTKLLRQ